MSLSARLGVAAMATVAASVLVPGALAAATVSTPRTQTTPTPAAVTLAAATAAKAATAAAAPAVKASATTSSPGGTQQSRPHPHRQPWPITITIETVPAMPNVRLTFDGRPLTTNAAGRASFTEQHNFSKHVLTLVDTSINTADRRYRFERWSGQRDPDQAFRPTVNGLPMRANYTVTAAFAVQYRVSPRFVDNQGQPVDPGTITAVTVRSDVGTIINLPNTGAVWLAGSLPSYQRSALVTRRLSYSLQSVMVNGANTVDAGRQRLDPSANATPTFILKFHDLTIGAHDALFHHGLGTAAELTYPDGTIRTFAFGPDHSVTVPHLPRGAYTVTVKGATGFAPAQHLTLSKDRDIDLTVASSADVGVIVAAVSMVALGLLLFGRFARVRRYLRSTISRLRRLVPTQKARPT